MFQKAAAGFLAGILILNTAVVPVLASEDEDSRFDDFLQDQFKETMEDDYMTMHYSVKDWQAMGLEKPDLVVDEISDDQYRKSIDENNKTLDALKEFDYDSLNDVHRHDYDAIQAACEASNAVNAYPELDFYFGPNGTTDNLITNFTEYVFYQKEDFEDYLTVLASVPAYLDEAIALTQKQAADGYFMTDTALDTVESSIADFTKKTDDSVLITEFDDQVDAFEGLTDEERQSYKERNRDIVLNQYIPAYQKVSDELEKLRGSRRNNGGIAGFKNGKDYYQAMVQYRASTSESVQDLFDECTDFLQDKIEDYMDLMQENQDNPFYENEQVSYTDPSSILDHLSQNTEEFPDAGSLNYTAEYLDDSVSNDTVVAYYVNNPVDDYSTNRIKINRSAVDDHNDLYVTLSHEGIPGHMYQCSYYHSLSPAYLRETMSFLGYSEGWAQYGETIAIKNSGLSDAAQQNLMLNDEINYVMDAAVDLAWNGLGYSEEQIGEWLDSLGMNSSSASSVITYVGDRAGMLLSYGIGMMKFLEYREAAEASLGSSFDPVSYHKVILDNGPRTFESVEADINAWLKSQGGKEINEIHSSTERTTQRERSPLVYGGICTAIVIVFILAAGVLHHYRKENPFQ